MAWAMAGAVLAMALHLRLRARPPCRRPPVLASGLGIAASLYGVFALLWGDDAALWRELGGVALFGVFAIAGWRRPRWLAVGWLAHVGWDLAMPTAHAAYVPAFYGPLCLGFDVVIAAAAWRLGAALNAAAAAPSTR